MKSCANCKCDLTNLSNVKLWDGKAYCRRCVQGASAALWEYATAYSELVETMPYPKSFFVKRMSAVAFVAFLLLLATAAIHVVATYEQQLVLHMFRLFAVLSCIYAPFAAIIVWMYVRTMEYKRPTVAVRDGMMRVVVGAKATAIPIQECTWREGNACEMNILERFSLLPDASVILLEYRHRVDQRHQLLAVGYDPKLREIWESFFKIAGIANRSQAKPDQDPRTPKVETTT